MEKRHKYCCRLNIICLLHIGGQNIVYLNIILNEQHIM